MAIKQIHIQHFKSIRDLKIEARRVNVFIGEPNTGKTNVLEALSLFSDNVYASDNFRKMVRMLSPSDLFFDGDISREIQVDIDNFSLKIEVLKDEAHLGLLKGSFSQPTPANKPAILDAFLPLEAGFEILPNGEIQNSISNKTPILEIRRYIFEKINKFRPSALHYLNPPFGDNLLHILQNFQPLQKQVADILHEHGFKLLLKPMEGEIHIAKENNDELTYPLQTISATWQRIIFLLAILETNQDQTLIMDEPEANIFPFFNTQIAETIGLYNTINQFFITTHNPYTLQSLIAKTPKDELAVFVTTMENFETKVKKMDSEQLSEAMDLGSSIFSNIDSLLAI